MTDMDKMMIEKVARALHDAEPPTYSDSFPPVVIPFDDLSPKRRKRIDELAEAALTAYNPDDRLREALEGAGISMRGSSNNGCTVEIKLKGSGRGVDADKLRQLLVATRDSLTNEYPADAQPYSGEVNRG